MVRKLQNYALACAFHSPSEFLRSFLRLPPPDDKRVSANCALPYDPSHISHLLLYPELRRSLQRANAMSGVEAIFGVVTGGAGLVSLGLQLGDSAKRLRKMYNTMKGAPKALDTLSFELETMALSLQLLEQQRQRLGSNSMEVVFERCLAMSQERTQEIQQLIDKMTCHMEKHARLRGKLYFAFKDQDVEELLCRLEKVKSSLQMAYAMYQNEVAHNTLAQHSKLLHGIQTRLLIEDIDSSPPSTTLLSNSTTSMAPTDMTGDLPSIVLTCFSLAHLLTVIVLMLQWPSAGRVKPRLRTASGFVFRTGIEFGTPQ